MCVSCLHPLYNVLFLVTACRRSKIGRSDSTSGVEWNVYILEKHTILSIAHEFVNLNDAVCTSAYIRIYVRMYVHTSTLHAYDYA